MPEDRFPQLAPKDPKTVVTQIGDAKRFLRKIPLSARELIALPESDLSLYIRRNSGMSEGVNRRISAGIYRIAEGSDDVVSIFEIYARLEDENKLRYLTYITQHFPPPFFVEDEKFDKDKKTQPRAFIGQYIETEGDIDDIIAGVEESAGIYDFGDLLKRFLKYFEGSTLYRWDFKQREGFTVAFRICYVSYRQVIDSSGEFDGEYKEDEKFYFVPFRDNTEELLTALTLLNRDIEIKAKTYHTKEGIKPQIKWILPLFPLMQKDQFLGRDNDIGKRRGLYVGYRELSQD